MIRMRESVKEKGVSMIRRGRKILCLLLTAVMAGSVSVPAFAAEGSGSEDGKIAILHTNDVHCAVDQEKNEDGSVSAMGYAAVAAYKAETEALYGEENVTLVDAGDAIQGGSLGTLSDGAYLVEIMGQVGYDLAVPGNHEYDYGMENFLTLAEEAPFSYLSCNFTDMEGNPVLDDYEIISYGDVDVAYVGITTPESFSKSTPAYFQDENGNYIYSFAQGNSGQDLYDTVQKTVDEALDDGADYVVAVGHLGNGGITPEWTSKAVIENTTGIDVFIDGHSHETYTETVEDEEGEPVVLTQTGTKLANMGKIVIDTDTDEITAELVNGYEQQDEETASFIADIEAEFAEVLQEVVAVSEVDLTTLDPDTGERAVRRAETNLGDLCADAYRIIGEADVAFVNGGGIRADIAAGDVTYEDIINVHPFGNELCVAEVTGQEILDALEMGAMNYPEENGGFLHVSGMTYTIDASVPSSVVTNAEGEFVEVSGEYRVKDVTVGGEPLNTEKTYTLASHNYMLKSGGDGYSMFRDNTILRDSVMLDNEVLINYITETLGGVIGEEYADPRGEGRITILSGSAEEPGAEEPGTEEPAAGDFTDVADGAWYAKAVDYVTENGYFNGVSDTLFYPEGTMTRAMFATAVGRLAGIDVSDYAGSAFSDVPEGQWYSAYVKWAADNGIVNGVGGGQFDPDAEITREQMTALLCRYAEYAGIDVTPASGASEAFGAFSDSASVSDYAEESMIWAVGEGLISGSEGRLLPKEDATRAQVAQIVMNFCDMAA